MINWVMKHYGKTKPVVIDGWLFVLIAMGGSMEAILTSKEVYEYMFPWIVFYLKMSIAILIAGAMALKTFRDKSYSQHREAEEAKTQQETLVETKSTNEKITSPNS